MNDDGSVSITEAAAAEILEMIRERDPQTTLTAEDIAAVTDMSEMFGWMGPMGGPGRPGGPAPENAGEPSVDFFMNDKVNAFSGVADEAAE